MTMAMTFEVIVEKNRIELRQTSKKRNVFNFDYCYVLLIFHPSVVLRFFTRWLLERVSVPLNIWIIVCSEIAFSKNLYHTETNQLICKANTLFVSRHSPGCYPEILGRWRFKWIGKYKCIITLPVSKTHSQHN